MRRYASELLAAKGDRPRHRAHVAHDGAQGRRLAGAVATHEADQFARGDGERDAAQDAARLDVHRELFEAEHAHRPRVIPPGTLPTMAATVPGSRKNSAGARSASTRPGGSATLQVEYYAAR